MNEDLWFEKNVGDPFINKFYSEYLTQILKQNKKDQNASIIGHEYKWDTVIGKKEQLDGRDFKITFKYNGNSTIKTEQRKARRGNDWGDCCFGIADYHKTGIFKKFDNSFKNCDIIRYCFPENNPYPVLYCIQGNSNIEKIKNIVEEIQRQFANDDILQKGIKNIKFGGKGLRESRIFKGVKCTIICTRSDRNGETWYSLSLCIPWDILFKRFGVIYTKFELENNQFIKKGTC